HRKGIRDIVDDRRHRSHVVAELWVLHFDDVGPEVAEELGAERTREEASEVEDDDAIEGRRHNHGTEPAGMNLLSTSGGFAHASTAACPPWRSCSVRRCHTAVKARRFSADRLSRASPSPVVRASYQDC